MRINFNSSSNFDKSRFGVDYTTINDELANQIKYIHFHNSDYRDIVKCKNICNEFNNVLKTFNSLEYINIGGHLEDLSFEEGIQYLNNIRKAIPESIKLIVELGDFLFKNVGKLYCKVIDAKYDGNKQLITLNFSKMANQRWVYPEYYSLSNEKELIDTFFYGSSCCETDLYAEVKSQKLEINDEVIFSNISPYSYEWNTSFNGIEKIKFLFNK